MCGLTGLIRAAGGAMTAADLDAMTDLVRHRGPDGFGRAFFGLEGDKPCEVGPEGPWRVALGHRRLKILDLSEAALQPMTDGAGRWLVYNGEVYNYLELRAELEAAGHRFHTTGDTEVILAAWREWGEACFDRFCGMWALLLVDLP
ncbi:MAG: asparagine synthetase B, partial [Acidobacteria bacterium]|nr:asparagine synthetase B [Acidobacteriota bacterium]